MREITEYDIISAIMNLVTSHEGVTNVSLEEDQVGYEVDTLRVRMIAEMDNVGLFKKPYTGFSQTINNFPVIKPQIGKNATIDVPRMVTRKDGEPAVQYIGGNDGISPYRVITGDQVSNFKHDMFLSKLPHALYEEGKFTFYNIIPSRIKIIGVFEKPNSLEEFDAYDSHESPYPCPSSMIDQIIGKTTESYIRTLYRTLVQPNTQSDLPVNAGSQKR